MADSDIQITAGSGTKVDTRTVGAGDDEHRQVVVIGDPTTAANVATVDPTYGLEVDVSRLPSIPAGTNAIGSITNTSFASTQSGTWTVQPGNTANTTPWLTRPSDGTNSVAIKAASTAAGATDPALVVAISPNNSIAINGLIPGVTSTSLGKAEDAAHVDGDTGVLVLGVRNHSTGANADGDYSAFSVSGIGDIHTLTRRTRLTATSNFTVAGAYALGDQMSSIFTFSNATIVSGGNGVISNVTVADSQNLLGAVDIVFFRQSVTLAADNGAFTLTNTDSVNIVGVVQIPGTFTIGSAKFGQAINIMMPFTCTATTLYAAMIARTANSSMSTVAGSVTLNITVERS